MSAEIRLRETEANLRAAQAVLAEKRRHWRTLARGAFTPGEAYEAFVLASIAYAAAADTEADIADDFEDARIDAQAEQIRMEQERITA